MGISIRFLICLSITSAHLISGYAWSDRLDRPNNFAPVLHEDDVADSIQENTFDEDVILESRSGAGNSNASSDDVTSMGESKMVPAWNAALDMEDETKLLEMYGIH